METKKANCIKRPRIIRLPHMFFNIMVHFFREWDCLKAKRSPTAPRMELGPSQISYVKVIEILLSPHQP